MIGLDSADLDYLLSVRSSLPAVSSLIDRGALHRLHTPGEIMTASVWPTFYTGSHPGEHGQYFPMQFDPDTMRFRRVGTDWLSAEPWWYALGHRGIPVTTLNVQVLMEARDVPGIEIANWGAQSFSHFRCNVPGLGREIARRFGVHPMGPDIPVPKSRSRLQAMRDELITGARQRGKLSRWLLAQAEWRLAIVVFTECHRAGHYFWPDESGRVANVPETALLDVHRVVDDEVSQLIAAAADEHTTVILFSLHGMGPNDAQDHFLRPFIDRLHARLAGDASLPHATAGARGNLMRTLRARLPGGVQQAVARAVPEAMRDWVTARSYGAGIDWPRVPGFVVPSGGEGYVRFNLVGRERRGCLEPNSEEHRRYAQRLRDELLALTVTATGRPLVKDIVEIQRTFAGARSDLLPDLVLVWHEATPATEVASPTLGTFNAHLATGRGGNHRPGAFAVVVGARAEQGRLLKSVTDFAPFVSALLT